VFSHPEYLHVAVHGVCKASGVAQFAHMHQLELSDFIAFGDGENDISMLQQVGHGVAMGNASPRVKQAVTRVTSSNQELGVVRYLENLLKLGLIG
jgi:hydroxymethylpyrimidine pyrophosphatase-like HAD family hydrolase